MCRWWTSDPIVASPPASGSGGSAPAPAGASATSAAVTAQPSPASPLPIAGTVPDCGPSGGGSRWRGRRWRRRPRQALLLKALRLRLRGLVQSLLDLLCDLLGVPHAHEGEIGVVGARPGVGDRSCQQ